MRLMGLHDHFRPPPGGRRHWHSFHNGWAFTIAAPLNELLPAGYFAEGNVHFGIEIDVASFDASGRRRFRSMLPCRRCPWLAGEVCVPVELNASYDRVCREYRIEPQM